tara:strand:+ start:501 stop:803 length:303 start_codon:yes stop_codon:yes gene_type:complete
MTFQRNVLTIAIVLFVLLLLFIASMMNNAKNNQAYPPELSDCPDYWQALNDGTCQNVNDLGNSTVPIQDFSKKSAKERCNWSKINGIEWDGISNASPRLC